MIDPLVVNSPAEFKALECVGVVCLNYGNLLRSVSGPAAALPLDEAACGPSRKRIGLLPITPRSAGC